MDINDIENLESIRKYESIIEDCSNDNYVGAIHYRNNYVESSPIVKPISKDDNLAKKIISTFKTFSNNDVKTFNEIIETLYNSKQDTISHDIDLVIVISFSVVNESNPTIINNISELNNTLYLNIYIPDDVRKEHLINLFNNFDNSTIKKDEFYKKYKSSNIGTMHNFCDRLDIIESILSCNSLLFSILSLYYYAIILEKNNVLVTLHTNKLIVSSTIGATLFFNDETDFVNKYVNKFEAIKNLNLLEIFISDARYKDVIHTPESDDTAGATFFEMVFSKYLGINWGYIDQIKKALPYSIYFDISHNAVKYITDNIINEEQLKSYFTDIGLDYNDKTYQYFLSKLTTRIYILIKFASGYCESKIEGKHLEHGFIFGNPKMITYWPFAKCYKLIRSESESIDNALNFKAIKQQIHYNYSPEKKMLILPYLFFPGEQQYEYNFKNNPWSIYSLEIDRLNTAINNWDYNNLYYYKYKPYGYLTSSNETFIAAYVGPNAIIRVFIKGHIIAYRDGLGWHKNEFLDIENNIHEYVYNNSCFEWLENIYIKEGDDRQKVLDTLLNLIRLSLYTSPIYNPEKKGTLILFSWNNDKNENNFKELDFYDFKKMNIHGNSSDENDTTWLKNQELFLNEDGKLFTNNQIINNFMSAADLDGCIVLTGRTCKVNHFAVKYETNMDQNSNGDSHRAAGTKRQAAYNYVKDTNTINTRFAITVSSDGPVVLHYNEINESGNKEHAYFEIFKMFN